ncbi:MAG TPA: hypothetical protein ENJ36_04030 [Candidatus Bathyarchaeota archaeon]|nr:hypothetical protein [Candidatus Bathyarchaeota archaeon]
MIKHTTIYYPEGGVEHTETTLKASLEAAKKLDIKTILVASTSGETGVKAAELYKDKGINLIVVGHQMGFPVPKVQQFKPDNWERIETLGGVVNLGTDVVTNSIRQRQRLGHSPMSIITQTLIAMKLKVNVEIVAKACDAGLIMPGDRVISIAGSHKGADTSAVFTANDSPNILDVRPEMFICYPLSREKADAEYMARRQAK